MTRKENKNSNINFHSVNVSAIPDGVDWINIEGSELKKFGPFNYVFVNFNDSIVAEIIFTFAYSCKGSYQGKGSYLLNANVSPGLLYAASRYTLDCNVTSYDPVNDGSATDPMPSIRLDLHMKITGPEKFYLQGNESFIPPKSPEYQNQYWTNSAINFSKEKICCKTSDNCYEMDIFASVCLRGDCSAELIFPPL